MKVGAGILKDFTLLKKNAKFPNIYDVEMTDIGILNRFDSFECRVVLYPYDRNINSDNITLNPYEESETKN